MRLSRNSPTVVDLRERLKRPRGGLAATVRALGYHVAPHHKEMCDYIEEHDGNEEHEGNRSLFLEPRGSGKSTIGCVGKSINTLIKDPEERILIVSDVFDNAAGKLREIKGHLESKNLVTQLFPHLKPKKGMKVKKLWQKSGAVWKQNEIVIRGKKKVTKEASVTAIGMMGPVTGKHWTTIILDDPVNFDNAQTPHQREKIYNWYRTTLLNCLEPGGTLIIIGTRYHWQDLYGKLIGSKKKPGRFAKCFLRRKAMWTDKDGKMHVLWPRHIFKGKPLGRTVAEVVELKEDLGIAIFNAQQQNDVEEMKGTLFRPDWLEPQQFVGVVESVYMGVDLAIGKTEKNDYFAIVVVVRTRIGELYFARAFRARLTLQDQIRAIVEIDMWCRNTFKVEKVRSIRIENQGYQQSLVEMMQNETDLNVLGVTQTRDKTLRSLATMQGPLQTGQLKIMQGGVGLADLVDEMLLFDEGEHDDLVDASELAVAPARDYRTIYARELSEQSEAA